MFVKRISRGQYKEELILNVTVFVVRVWGKQYREVLIMNITVFFVRVRRRPIQKGTDTENYCVCCEGLGREL